jgi:ubiquitin-protein ligase
MEKKEINELVINRLKKERKEWRGDHPFGFVAKPVDNPDGTTNMLKWHCEIPGPKDCPWEGGSYSLAMDFTHDFPVRYAPSQSVLPNASSSLYCRTPTSTRRGRCACRS